MSANGNGVERYPAHVAAFFTNKRGIRLWHDPTTGKFAPAGFVSVDVLKRLYNGSADARRELTDATRKAREADPQLSLANAPNRILGPRPTDATDALHWDAAKRTMFASWRRSTPSARMIRSPQMAKRPPVDKVPASARLAVGSSTDYELGLWKAKGTDAHFSLEYASDTDEYSLTRVTQDPTGTGNDGMVDRGVDFVSGKFPPGTPRESIAQSLATKGEWADFDPKWEMDESGEPGSIIKGVRSPFAWTPADLGTAPKPEPKPETLSVIPLDDAKANMALKQIGTMNVMAVSGGRSSIDPEGRLVLPVASGYRVRVSLAPDDTYTVERVHSRGGVDSVKGRVDGIYADQLGDTVYRASNFRDSEPFGQGGGTLKSQNLQVPPTPQQMSTDLMAQTEEQGGFTFDPRTGEFPAQGIAVGVSGHSAIIKHDEWVKPGVAEKFIGDYLRKMRDDGVDDTVYIGGWWDKEHDEVVLDRVDVFADREEGIRAGRERGEQAVFDLGAGEEIDTGGTGGRENYDIVGAETQPPGGVPAEQGLQGSDGLGDRGTGGNAGGSDAGSDAGLTLSEISNYSDSYLLSLWSSDKSPALRQELVQRGLIQA